MPASFPYVAKRNYRADYARTLNKEVPAMRAAKMKERPSFQLMVQTDVQSIYHMQMPRWLFSDPRYCEMSLDAKVAYTFLLNRFQLSRKNGWVNDRGEVFVIFPRKALAKELRICEQRVTAAFKKLVELKLVWEKRCGRGDANQIYLARVTPIEDPDYSCAPFITEDESEVRGSRTSDQEGLADGKPSAACQEPQNLLSKNREDRASRTAKSAFPEPQKLTPSKKEKRKIDQSHMEVRPSVRAPAQDGRTDGDAEEELLDILDGCELECFAPETALVFENAIERLFYADSFRIGNATLPQSRVRAKLRRLDGMILREAESKLRANQERNVKNSTAYTMAVLFNCIAESESDLMIDPSSVGIVFASSLPVENLLVAGSIVSVEHAAIVSVSMNNTTPIQALFSICFICYTPLFFLFASIVSIYRFQ